MKKNIQCLIFASAFLVFISIFVCFAPAVTGDFGSYGVISYSIFSLAFGTSGAKRFDGLTIMVVLCFINTIVSIVAGVYSLKRFDKLGIILFSIASSILSLTCGILSLCIFPMTGTTANEYVHLGAGAICFSIISFISMIPLIVSFVLLYKKNALSPVSQKVIADENKENVNSNNNTADYYHELKNLKDLLDNGIITQQEFEEKKAKIFKI